MKLVVWFPEVGKDDVGRVGGKGANLGELTRAGIPVPPGFILTANAYFQLLEESGLKAKIQGLLTGLNVDDSNQLQEVAAEIKEAIIATPMPQKAAGPPPPGPSWAR